MQRLGMGPCSQKPAREGGVTNAKDALRRRDIQSFGQGSQHEDYASREQFAGAVPWLPMKYSTGSS